MLKKFLKHSLLQWRGYSLARRFYMYFEHHALSRTVSVFLKTGLLPLPDKAILEPTLRCNLRCSMCYQERSAFTKLSELSVPQLLAFFEQAPFLKTISLIGGEIFIRQDILTLIRQLNEHHDLVLSTNGTLLNSEVLTALKICSRIFTICLSLDGPQEFHDRIRHVHGSYAKTVHAIKKLTSVLPVTVNCVILAENLEVLPEFVESCARMGVGKIKLEFERRYSDTTLQETRDALGLSADDAPLTQTTTERRYPLQLLRQTLQECQQRAKHAGVYLLFDPYFLTEHLEECYTSTLRGKRRYLCKNFRTVTITPAGDVIHCRKIRKVFGNILEAPFENIWNNNTAYTYRQRLLQHNLTPVCENCPSLIALNQ